MNLLAWIFKKVPLNQDWECPQFFFLYLACLGYIDSLIFIPVILQSLHTVFANRKNNSMLCGPYDCCVFVGDFVCEFGKGRNWTGFLVSRVILDSLGRCGWVCVRIEWTGFWIEWLHWIEWIILNQMDWKFEIDNGYLFNDEIICWSSRENLKFVLIIWENAENNIKRMRAI